MLKSSFIEKESLMSLHTIPCVLFAGGKSSRMGEDKSLLPFAHSKSLAQYQYMRLKEIFSDVYISTKETAKFDHINAKFIEDAFAPEVHAPTVGFVSIFMQLKTENAVFVLSVDTPFVTKEVIKKLLKSKISDYDAVIVRTPGGIHPLCGIYSRTLLKPMMEMIKNDNHKLNALLKRSNVHYVDIEDEDLLMNINTQDEYKKALDKL